MATTYYNDLQKLYVAYFNRPGDTSGLANYEAQLEAAGTDAKAIAAVMARISTEFSNSTEYKANFTGKTNAEIVDTVYMNLFGRPADDGGKKFYADNLTAGKLTVAAVVTEVAKGAQGSDAVAYNNKVTAATAFSAALKSTDSYNTQAAATAAKTFLSGVTDNASLAQAVDPIYLQLAITKVNAAAQPFSLQTGLDALNAANAVKISFLDGADGKMDGKFGTGTDAAAQQAAIDKIGTDVGSKSVAVTAIVDANVAANEQGLYATTTNAAVKAALLAEAQAHLASNLTTAQANVTADNTAIAAVPGLGAAITALTDAGKAATAAATADTAAHTAVAVGFAAYNAQNTTALPAPTADTYAAHLVAAGSLITASSAGVLSLKTGVTEATNPGVTALLNALVAEKAADTAKANAITAQTNAQASVDYLDGTPAYESALKAVAAGMTLNKLPAGTLPTEAQISAELAGLLAVKTAADAGTDANAKAAAATAYNNFNTLVTTFHAADDHTNPLSANLTTDTGAVSTAQDAVKALSDALSALSTATNLQAQLTAVTAQVTAATNAFAAKGLMAPVMLETTTAATGTFGADIFVAGTKNATIAGFDTNGVDSLYIGTKFGTLGTSLANGNDAAIEAFVTKNDAGNVVISIEKDGKPFASHATGGADLIQITLTGVTDVSKVHLNNGIITVS